MSQKTNPTSLRLQKGGRRTFLGCWYSDLFYNEIRTHESELNFYINRVFKQIEHSPSFFCFKHYYKKSQSFLFTHDLRASRREKQFSLNLPVERSPQQALPLSFKRALTKSIGGANQSKGIEFPHTFNDRQHNFVVEREDKCSYSKNLTHSLTKLGKQIKVTEDQINQFRKDILDLCVSAKSRASKVVLSPYPRHSKRETNTRQIENNFFNRLDILSDFWKVKKSLSKEIILDSNDYHSTPLNLFYSKYSNLSNSINKSDDGRSISKAYAHTNQHVQSSLISTKAAVLSNRLKNHNATFFSPIRIISDIQNVDLILDRIVDLLQRRVSFRRIRSHLFRELSTYPSIKGCRISCSGRFGGRSKKAQKAKVESEQYGEISLNVFSSCVAFATKSAQTAYGEVGVKVWVSFKENKSS